MRSGCLRAYSFSCLLALICLAGPPAAAQDKGASRDKAAAQDKPPAQDKPASPQPGKPPADIQKMIDEGMAEALESKFAGGRTAEELQQIAAAYRVKAIRARQPADRQRANEKCEQLYRKAIATLEKARGAGAKGTVLLGGAHVEYAGAIMSAQVAGELDDFEITAGQRGDREKLGKLLGAAREEYEKAQTLLKPLIETIAEHEDELYAEGMYEPLEQSYLDSSFNLGWVNLYQSIIEQKDEQKKRDLAHTAERYFQDLLDSGRVGEMLYQCYLGLAVAQREQRKFDEAARSFGQAMQDGVPRAIEAQARYELARCDLMQEKFDEARAVLQPLVDKDPRNLSAEDRPARFYVNLAHLWEANSHLLEAEAARRDARDSVARTAILQKADRSRQVGLSKLNALAAQGGPWPGIVQIYVAASVNTKADPKSLSPTELLYVGSALSDAGKYKDALARLQEAAGREGVEPALMGQILFELGKCQFRLDDLRAAATTFQRVALEYKALPVAPQAATLAYQVWTRLARQTNRKEDFAHLAETLLNLVQSFPDHEDRPQAMWWLPIALQSAGRYDEAAAEFGKVSENSPNREEAQFRRATCARLAVETQRGSLPAAEYEKKAREAVHLLLKYSDEAYERGARSADKTNIHRWSADARIQAADLLVSPGLDQFREGLDTVSDFEKRYPDSGLIGRVLSLRIRGHRGLREFEQASRILEQYLQAVPPEQAGGTLAVLAKGMQEEVDRLMRDGQVENARKLAAESVVTFEELEKWVLADQKRARSLPVVTFGRAQMLYYAGQYPAAGEAVAKLLEASPRDGNYQHLQAQVLTDSLSDTPAPDALKAAKEAWGKLLADPSLRSKQPERYWEARYNWLVLLFREGGAADVEKAIRQDRVWFPGLGGSPWKEKLDALYHDAAAKAGVNAEESPEPASAPADQANAGNSQTGKADSSAQAAGKTADGVAGDEKTSRTP